mgnify:CR=1 FL=1
MKYVKIWRQLTVCSFSSTLSNRVDALSYLLGKIVRFAFFWLFISSLFHFTSTFAGYTKYEALLIYLTFNVIDVLAQIFLRGIYLFRHDVNSGAFDYTLAKPLSPLFYILSRLNDLLDIIFSLPIIALLIYVITKLPVSLTLPNILLYIFLVILGLSLVLSLHIISAAITIRTVESDHIIWFYRDALGLARLPTDILPDLLKIIFTYVLPVIVAVTFPTKALLGRLDLSSILLAIGLTLIFYSLSLHLWKSNLKKYSSASS